MSRIWDPFLTDRDRKHLDTRTHAAVGFGDRPAILLIDNYRSVFGERRQTLLDAIVDEPTAIGEDAWDAADRIADLLAVSRRASIPVIHITAAIDTGLPGWYETAHPGGRAPRAGSTSTEAASRYEIVEKCAPIEGEMVFRKLAPSAFWGTPLVAALNHLNIDTLIVGGESTSGCVRASVVDAATYRYRVVVVEECVYDRHQAAHAINLFDMHQKYADVLPLADVIGWIAKRPAAGATAATEVA